MRKPENCMHLIHTYNIHWLQSHHSPHRHCSSSNLSHLHGVDKIPTYWLCVLQMVYLQTKICLKGQLPFFQDINLVKLRFLFSFPLIFHSPTLIHLQCVISIEFFLDNGIEKCLNRTLHWLTTFTMIRIGRFRGNFKQYSSLGLTF